MDNVRPDVRVTTMNSRSSMQNAITAPPNTATAVTNTTWEFSQFMSEILL